MKTKHILSLCLTMISLVILTGFSLPSSEIKVGAGNTKAAPAEDNIAYTISLSPSAPVQGNTDYDVLVSYASGNQAYKLTMITGFMILSGNPIDINASGNTVFHIKTYPNVTHIVGRIDAWVCSPSCSWTDYQNFAF